MARNNHLYTVHHSLENYGAFDKPITDPSVERHPLQGKYYQEPTEYPKYIRKTGHTEVIVKDADEESAVFASWAAQYALKATTKVIAEKNEADPSVREALVEKAKKLGLKVDGRTSDKKLAYMVEEAEQAA